MSKLKPIKMDGFETYSKKFLTNGSKGSLYYFCVLDKNALLQKPSKVFGLIEQNRNYYPK